MKQPKIRIISQLSATLLLKYTGRVEGEEKNSGEFVTYVQE